MSVSFNFRGKRALVTGAGKGIGRNIAKALHKSGADVVAVSRSQEDLDSLKKECPGIEVLTQDLSQWTSTRNAISQFGTFDFLVNNAGVGKVAPFLDISEEALNVTMDTNFKSVFNVSQVVARGMVERGGGGSIVNISSQASKVAIKDHAAYCPSKAAVDSLTQVMALELGPRKIRVNSVNPTIVMTAMGRLNWSDPAKGGPALKRIPLGRFAEEDEVTSTVLFLLSDQASMITGSAVPVDGGYLCN